MNQQARTVQIVHKAYSGRILTPSTLPLPVVLELVQVPLGCTVLVLVLVEEAHDDFASYRLT